MSKFKVGDRVIPYGHGCIVEERCTVVAIRSDEELEIRPDGETRTWGAHPKQCRKLKPKAARRHIWIGSHALRALSNFNITNTLVTVQRTSSDDVEFVEVRNKESA